MSENTEKKKFPLWVKIVIILSTFPIVMLPVVITNCSVAQYENVKMFLFFYPFYVVASAIMAWISYRQRPDVTAILIILQLLSHVAIWMLPTAI